jgi:glycosyltransferase involved in cell wall biosynthesis
MKILWFTWEDKKNPRAGGAELVNEELAERLICDGHEVIFLVGGFPGASKEEMIKGYRVIRVGNKWTVYWKAYRYYKKNLKGWADLVIDEINTVPFFCKFFVQEKKIVFVHQLARKIWFYEMFFPLSVVGYLLEPLYLRLLSNQKVITVSASTKKDLMRYGFKPDNINIISEGIEIEPIISVQSIEKYPAPTVLGFGSIRPMKKTILQIKAFEEAKKSIPELKMLIAGGGKWDYIEKTKKLIAKSQFQKDIIYLGKVSLEKKIELMQKSHLLLATSTKEGWGLTITEANSQGTPAVTYDVDGLRDAVRDGETGIICKKNNPTELGNEIVKILSDTNKYQKLQQAALDFSREINFDKSYAEFISSITSK